MPDLQVSGVALRAAKALAKLGKPGRVRRQREHVAEARGIQLVRRMRSREGVVIANPGRDAIEAARYHRKLGGKRK